MKIKVTFLLTLLLLVFRNGFSQNTYKYLGTWNSSGVPNYLETNSDTIKKSLLDQIYASLPESRNVLSHHPQYLSKGAKTDILLKEKAEVYVTFVYEGAGYLNSLGFYTYNKNTSLDSARQIKDNMTIIFPNCSMPGSGGCLKPGSKVKLGVFDEGTKIGWFILSNGFKSGKVTDGLYTLYSDEKLNPEPDTTKRQHNILLKDTDNGRIVLGFEDVRRDMGSDNDFNDVLFYITANPFRAIDTSYIPPVDKPVSVTTDIKVTKTVNSQAPDNGSEIEYTITTLNTGSSDATSVKVSDLLPSGLEFVSASASSGSYASSTGVWTIDELNKGKSTTLTIKAKVNLYSNPYTLGPAKGYNVFALNDFESPSSDAEGKVAVGHDANFLSYSVGYKLTPDSSADVLIVGNDLNFSSGAVYGGNVVYNHMTNLPINPVSIINGTLKKASVIDFGAAAIYLNTLSSTLSTYTVNGTTKSDSYTLNLTGSDPVLNVFNVTADEIRKTNDFNVNVPNGSVAVINIAGDEISWTGGLRIVGTAKNNILYNFYEASSVAIHGIDVRGSVLAPKADIYFPAGLVSGQMIAKNIYGSGKGIKQSQTIGQFNNDLFIGNIPVDRKINNSAQITSLDQTDSDSTNNSASALINVAYSSDPNTGKNTGTQSWTKASSIPDGYFIWTMMKDNSGRLMAGTFGGKILRLSQDGTQWSVLNDSMKTGYIWSLTTAKTGTILAATANGLYKSYDNGATWKKAGLDSLDVRALAVEKEGSIYAGTWGTGMFKSSDNGESWKDISGGLISRIINSISINSNSEIYAATFGSGIEKSSDHGITWSKVNIGYDHIWSVASSGSKIYAGTYGDGLYFSNDCGSTWQKSYDLDADYIYSVSPDNNGNVYLSTWSSGVYVSYNTSEKWNALGMKGLGVSAVYADPSSGLVLASSNNGGIYSISSLTAVNNDTRIPSSYSLEQNYPNPFNPSTVISYTIPKAGHVTLKVYDMLGKEVATLVNGTKQAGIHQAVFNASGFSSGTYMYRIVSGSFSLTKKMLLLK
jgi:choice-of-anchor A domain-containing protein/uncharacterized repeat protein (TIGR01451 family)